MNSKPLTSSDEARDAILRRIREALPGEAKDVTASYRRVARDYNREDELPRDECIELFVDRLIDYDTEVFRVDDESAIPEAVARALSVRGEESLLAAEEFPSHWLPGATTIIRDTHLTKAELELMPAVITTCEAAVASTGTLFLVHQGAQGRRAITLLPDHFICLVRSDQVFENLPRAMAEIMPSSTKPITTISGPSATSDIEMTRIRGVHGPRRLSVILYG